MDMSARDVEHTTRFIRQLVAEDLAAAEAGSDAGSEEAHHQTHVMVQIPLEELQQTRLMLRQFILYLKSQESRLGGNRPVDCLNPDEMKRLAWLYERRIKAWLEMANTMIDRDSTI
jgi:hypothetical protein